MSTSAASIMGSLERLSNHPKSPKKWPDEIPVVLFMFILRK